MCNGEKKALNKSVTYTVMYTESKRSNVCNRKYNTVFTTENSSMCIGEKKAQNKWVTIK